MRKKMFIFLLFFVCLAGQARSQTNDREAIINIHYERGINFYRHGDYDKAMEELERILEVNPKHAKAKKYLSVITRKRNKNKVKGLYKQAEVYYRQRDYQKALDVYQKALELLPEDEYSLYRSELLRAKIEKSDRLRKKQMDKQKQKTEKLEKNIKAKKKKELREKQKALSKELALKGDNQKPRVNEVKAAYNRGREYYNKEEYLKAVELFQEVISLEKDAEKIYTVRANEYMDLAKEKLYKQKHIEKEKDIKSLEKEMVGEVKKTKGGIQ